MNIDEQLFLAAYASGALATVQLWLRHWADSVTYKMTKLCRVMSSTPIALAKSKQSQLFERSGIYGIDDACKIEAVQ